MVNYYTLEQAAQILRVSPDTLREMAKKNEVRAFQDRGSLRFRAQEIDELARSKGLGSDTDMPVSAGKQGPASPRPTQVGKKPGKSTDDDDSDEVPIGNDPGMDRSGSRSSSRIGKSGPRTGIGKSPPPKPASDSDVRLVMEGSDLDFEIKVDSGVKLSGPATPPAKIAPKSPSPPKSGPKSSGLKSGPKSSGPRSGPKAEPKSSGPASPPSRSKHPSAGPDSGIRVTSRDKPSDSDVRLSHGPDEVVLGEQGVKAPSDSDIRVVPDNRVLESGKKLDNVTEEIDLDAEQAAAMKAAPPPRTRPPSNPALPTSSPFELSEPDVNLSGAPSGTPAAKPSEPESSDFELSLDDSSEEFTLASEELPILGDAGAPPASGPGATKGTTGINLDDPVDSGISLEESGSDEIEFELSLDPGASSTGTRKGKAKDEDSSSSSDFELSLDEEVPTPADSSDSEFELNLDVEGSDDLVLESASSESESEFELTLDDAGGLQVEDESGSSEAEVFETDFDVPGLSEDSGSDALALEESDADIESSDFDLALDEEPVEESGSDAVALEESEEDFDEMAPEEEPAYEEEAAPEEEEEMVPAGAAAAAAPPAPWGVIPAIFLLPSVIILFLVGIMSFELVQGMWGYHKPSKVSNLIIDPIARMLVDDKLPKD
jgi:excisionase family DNA binding protein